MIILGIILLLLGYLAPVPSIVGTIGLILVILGAVLWVLGSLGRPIGGRPHWF